MFVVISWVEMGWVNGVARLLFLFLVMCFGLNGVTNARHGYGEWEDFLRMATESTHHQSDLQREADDNVGTRWAILIAGSSGYGNYRHQADVCHAYQIMRRGGLKEENIVVFMYDDIAYNGENPRPGTIINHPNGKDVYAGVPKDYVGESVNVNNFFAVLLGDRGSVQGGSGKVVDSGPNDRIFIFYSDHGGPGVLGATAYLGDSGIFFVLEDCDSKFSGLLISGGMPLPPYLYANDLVEALKKKHASGTYKEMVFYLEACESGSIFEGLLPKGLNIYVTTQSNAEENSWATYCPDTYPPCPPEYNTCLGDLYSVAWMEDSEMHNLKTETIKQQYELVKGRTSDGNTYRFGSHVMQYGDISINRERLSLYMGFDPANANATFPSENSFPGFIEEKEVRAVNQRDADLLYLWQKYKRFQKDSHEKLEAEKQMTDMMTHRVHIDKSIGLIGKLLFGSARGPAVLKSVQPSGQPLVEDWDCLKSMVRIFETHCGSLGQYGMKHMRSLANICNEGVGKDIMVAVSAEACTQIPLGVWSSLERGLSA